MPRDRPLQRLTQACDYCRTRKIKVCVNELFFNWTSHLWSFSALGFRACPQLQPATDLCGNYGRPGKFADLSRREQTLDLISFISRRYIGLSILISLCLGDMFSCIEQALCLDLLFNPCPST